MAETIDVPSSTAPIPTYSDDRILAKLADLEQQERDAIKAIRATQERLLGIRGGIAVLRELAAPLPEARVRTVGAPPIALSSPDAASGRPGPKPSGRWSRDHDACIGCARTEVRHASHGRCASCYAKHRARTEQPA